MTLNAKIFKTLDENALNRWNSGGGLKLSVSFHSGKSGVLRVCVFLARSYALFIGPVSTKKHKSNFKIGFHGTISHL